MLLPTSLHPKEVGVAFIQRRGAKPERDRRDKSPGILKKARKTIPSQNDVVPCFFKNARGFICTVVRKAREGALSPSNSMGKFRGAFMTAHFSNLISKNLCAVMKAPRNLP